LNLNKHTHHLLYINQTKFKNARNKMPTGYRFLFLDLETTGFIKAPKGGIDLNKDEQFPDIVQMSWQLHFFDPKLRTYSLVSDKDFIIRPTPLYTIPPDSTKIHGISHEHALIHGVPLEMALQQLASDLFREHDTYHTYLVCHNVEFDVPILMHKLLKAKNEKMDVEGVSLELIFDFSLVQECICTMLDTVDLCKLPYANGGRGYKYPKLSELFYTLFHEAPKGQLHNSKFDVECLVACFKELRKRGTSMTIRNVKLGDTNGVLHKTPMGL
jgi:DNA polymerase-3 subunit epsilon